MNSQSEIAARAASALALVDSQTEREAWLAAYRWQRSSDGVLGAATAERRAALVEERDGLRALAEALGVTLPVAPGQPTERVKVGGLVDHRPRVRPVLASTESALLATDKANAERAKIDRVNRRPVRAREAYGVAVLPFDSWLVMTADRMGANALRRAASGRSTDYARRLAQTDNSQDVGGDVMERLLVEGVRLQGADAAPLPGWNLEMVRCAVGVAAWARGDAVTLALALGMGAHSALTTRGDWHRQYGVARSILADRIDPVERRTVARCLAYLVRRLARVAPESGVKGERQVMPTLVSQEESGVARPVRWVPETLGRPTAAEADASDLAAYSWERLGQSVTGKPRVIAVTEWADAGAGNRYVARVAYAATGYASGDATVGLSCDALAREVAADPALRDALRALIRADGVAALYGTILPGDVLESRDIGSVMASGTAYRE